MADDVPVKRPHERSRVQRPLKEITRTDEEGTTLQGIQLERISFSPEIGNEK
jgi:hypothetical protein